MAKKQPIEGNRKHEVEVAGADARACETAASALTGKGEITRKRADAAAKRLDEIGKRFRSADRKAAKKK